MTRRARIESETGIYHVMMRGINRQDIFEYREDQERFIGYLYNAKEKSGIRLFGYCLMNNHVHVVIKTGTEPVGVVFKRIGVSYANWYNRKYERQGPLFQDRFKSEPVLDDSYLLSVLRYIHQNPIRAGLCKKAEDYEWSSYTDYIETRAGIADTTEVLEMFSSRPAGQTRLFKEFSGISSEDSFVDIDNVTHPTDETLREKVVKICGSRTANEFQQMLSDERDKALRAMRASGMSIRQIVRLTGVPFGIIRKI
jgi:REP element-mobilizing transposase RayT